MQTCLTPSFPTLPFINYGLGESGLEHVGLVKLSPRLIRHLKTSTLKSDLIGYLIQICLTSRLPIRAFSNCGLGESDLDHFGLVKLSPWRLLPGKLALGRPPS